MTQSEFYSKIEEILEADSGTLNGDEFLESLEGWDSLAVIQFIAVVDQEFGVQIPVAKLSGARSVADLVGLLGDKISS